MEIRFYGIQFSHVAFFKDGKNLAKTESRCKTKVSPGLIGLFKE
jgi:hypothetical protein